MLIDLRKSNSPSHLSFRHYAFTLCGCAVDERGNTAVNEISKHSDSVHVVQYHPEIMAITVDGQRAQITDLRRLIARSDEPIAIEATTLGFAEVLLCCHAAYSQSTRIDFLYVEPENYARSHESHLFSKRDFELSGEIVGFRGIPGVTRILDDKSSQRFVFFLGYEGSRFRRAFTDLEVLSGRRMDVIFGVPAFKAGWEMDSIANNIPVLKDENVNSVYYCGADNPRAAVEFLSTTYESLQSDETMFIAPIGTKPHGIATALFSAKQSKVGIIYDHPIRIKARSSAIGQWHLFSVTDFV